jgi:hypothetical protein
MLDTAFVVVCILVFSWILSGNMEL